MRELLFFEMKYWKIFLAIILNTNLAMTFDFLVYF